MTGRRPKPNGLIDCEIPAAIRGGNSRFRDETLKDPIHLLTFRFRSHDWDSEIMNLPFNRSGTQDPRVRKQVYELTLQDLSAFPIWEFRVDDDHNEGRDESTVGPYSKPAALDPTDRMFVVRAIFTLADGSKMQGYLTPPGRGEEGIGALQPIIVTDRGQIRLWCGTTPPDSKRLARCYDWLGKRAADVFPAQFESDVTMLGGPITGSVPGFLVMEDFQTRRTRTVT